jgi:hypothetical protein
MDQGKNNGKGGAGQAGRKRMQNRVIARTTVATAAVQTTLVVSTPVEWCGWDERR